MFLSRSNAERKGETDKDELEISHGGSERSYQWVWGWSYCQLLPKPT